MHSTTLKVRTGKIMIMYVEKKIIIGMYIDTSEQELIHCISRNFV
jgi:20S proteasome alpha/beta subunit